LNSYKLKGVLIYSVIASYFLLTHCISTSFFPSTAPALREYEIEKKGRGDHKILMIDISGVLSTQADKGTFSSTQSIVHRVTNRLEKAANDPEIKAVILRVNSPGGTVTASDILYNQIKQFKARRSIPVVVSMLEVAASGGYYLSLAADEIVAYPSTITGSIGVIFMRYNISELSEKVGFSVAVSKSGSNKDMGSPFREPTGQEDSLFNAFVEEMGEAFVGLVAQNRSISDSLALEEVASARIFSGNRARELGLIDQLGSVEDAVERARFLGNIPPTNYKVVAYGGQRPNNPTLYIAAGTPGGDIPKNSLQSLLTILPSPGAYYLWEGALLEAAKQ